MTRDQALDEAVRRYHKLWPGGLVNCVRCYPGNLPPECNWPVAVQMIRAEFHRIMAQLA